MINKKMVVGLIIHSIMAVLFLLDWEYGFLFYFVLLVVTLNIIGMVLVNMDYKILGARIFLISSVMLIPIGIIGAMGANEIIDEEKSKRFNESNN